MSYVNTKLWAERLDKKLKEQFEKYYIERDRKNANRYVANYYAFLKKIAKRHEDKRDAVVALTGRKGEGKSNTGVISSLVLSHMLGTDFDLHHNVFYTYDVEEAAEKIVGSQKQIYFFDEAIDVMGGADAATRMQKFLAKIFVKSRKLRHIIFLAMPKMWMFSKIFRADLIHFRVEHLIRIENYARTALLVPDEDPDNPDPWFLERKGYYASRRKHLRNRQEVIRYMRRDPNFLFYMNVPRLPKPIEKEYEKASIEALGRMAYTAKELKALNAQKVSTQVNEVHEKKVHRQKARKAG